MCALVKPSLYTGSLSCHTRSLYLEDKVDEQMNKRGVFIPSDPSIYFSTG